MATLERPDGVELHWEERGDGPLVVLGSYWSMHPTTFEPLIAELDGDHRVVLYHDRGTGSSTRRGPYDLETSSRDLEAVTCAAGGHAVVVTTADGCNRTVRVAARRPELVRAMITVGGAPLPRSAIDEYEAMLSSDTVVEAFLELAKTDYRSALRSLMGATNPQLGEEGMRRRVAIQVEHAPEEAGVARLQAWAADDATDYARAAAERLWFLSAPDMTGGWFPSGADYERMIRAEIPGAHVERVDDGLVSRPDQTASVIRRITAPEAALVRGA
jgi:pimeloyl-ACP methyl ester carboxylesterase